MTSLKQPKAVCPVIKKATPQESQRFIRSYYLKKSKKWAGLNSKMIKGVLVIKGAL